MCVLVSLAAGNDKKVVVNISRSVLARACQDGGVSLMGVTCLMSCTFLYHASTLLLYLCIFSIESIKYTQLTQICKSMLHLFKKKNYLDIHICILVLNNLNFSNIF